MKLTLKYNNLSKTWALCPCRKYKCNSCPVICTCTSCLYFHKGHPFCSSQKGTGFNLLQPEALLKGNLWSIECMHILQLLCIQVLGLIDSRQQIQGFNACFAFIKHSVLNLITVVDPILWRAELKWSQCCSASCRIDPYCLQYYYDIKEILLNLLWIFF